MAFRKKAQALLQTPHLEAIQWENFKTRQKGVVRVASQANLIQQASEILGEQFDPDNYLLTHSTIVASVDIEDVPNVRLGSDSYEGHPINRKFGDYYVTANTDPYINNNNDAWSRPVIMKSYRTFVGAQNFIEHVQLEHLSKGRIIDAVARDIGPSVYIDILTATNRKHADLIRAIESGRMGTLSMGCFLAGTQVSMANGTRVAIEDVAPGDMVLTHKGRFRPVNNKQIRSYRGELRHIKVVGSASTINATANHGFEVLRPPKTCACGCGEDLPVGGTANRRMKRRFKNGHDKRIFNPNNTYSLEEARKRRAQIEDIKSFTFEKVRADELEVGDFVCFPRSLSAGQVEGWTIGKARLLGYFLAEGSFLKRKGQRTETQFNFSLEEKTTFVQEVVDLFNQEFPGGNPWVQERPKRNTCVVHFYNHEVADWFYRHAGEYSHGKKLSDEVMGLPSEFHREIFSTWMNGDGFYNPSGSVYGVATTSYDLACQMHMLLSSIGVFGRIECKQDGRTLDIAQAVGCGWSPNPETGKRPYLQLLINSSQIKPFSSSCNRVQKVSAQKQHLRVLDTHIIFPIKSIETSFYEGLVFNMEVDEDHTYVVEGVTVHNCTASHTTCTKCGNVAVDDVELCPHIRHMKGNYFFDTNGVKRRIAELCGHASEEPTGGIHFIEASWVGTPAFEGAVLNKIVEPLEVNSRVRSQFESVIKSSQVLPEGWKQQKAARLAQISQSPVFDRANVLSFDFGDDEDEGDSEKKEAPGGFTELEDEVEKYVLDNVKKKLRDKLRSKVQEEAISEKPEGELETSTGNDIVRQGSNRFVGGTKEISYPIVASEPPIDKKAFVYQAGIGALVKTSSSDIDLIERIAQFNNNLGISISKEVYRAALRLGATAKYQTPNEFLMKAEKVLGRAPKPGEAKTLIRLGKILGLRPRKES